VDNFGDDWYNPLLQLVFGILALQGRRSRYPPVTEGRYLTVARSPASMVPTSSPPKPRFPKEVGAARRCCSGARAWLTILPDSGNTRRAYDVDCVRTFPPRLRLDPRCHHATPGICALDRGFYFGRPLLSQVRLDLAPRAIDLGASQIASWACAAGRRAPSRRSSALWWSRPR
jgi:hypothetical protein